MQINRESLLSSLEQVQAGLSTKGNTLEQSNSFVFQAGQVITFNGEVSCRAPTPLSEKITGAVWSKPLLEILSKLPDENLEVLVKDEALVLVGKNKRESGVRMEKEITLPVLDIEPPGAWHELHPEFCEAVGTVQKCAGKEQLEFAQTCVYVHPKWVEATDDSQLCKWRLKTGFESPLLARQGSIKHITSLGMTEFSETENWVHFRNQNKLVLSCLRFSTDDYPKTKGALDFEGRKVVLPKGLVKVMERCSIFSSDDKDNNLVNFTLDKGQVTLKGQGASGWHVEHRKVNYKGPRIEFLINPELLSDIIQNHNDCVIGEDKLRVDAGKYQYMTMLHVEDEKTEEAQEETEE